MRPAVRTLPLRPRGTQTKLRKEPLSVMLTSRRLHSFVLLFLATLSLYLLTFKGIDAGDNLLHYDVAKTFVRTGHFCLPARQYDLNQQGWLKMFVAAGSDGYLYSTLPPGLALLSVPFAGVGVVASHLDPPSAQLELDKPVGQRSLEALRQVPSVAVTTMVNPVVCALLMTVFAKFVFLLSGSLQRALTVTGLLATTTILWPYATTYWTQPLVALCLFGALYQAHKWTLNPRDSILGVAGLLAGLSCLARYEMLLLAPWMTLPIMAACVPSWRRVFRSMGLFLFFFSLPPLVQAWWNLQRYGSLLNTGSAHQRLWAASLHGDLPVALAANLFSLNRSLLVFSPPLVLFFFSIGRFVRQRRWLGVSVLGVSVTALLIYSKFIFWTATGSWGPRYLVPLTPFLLLPVALWPTHTRWRRALLWNLFGLGLAVQLVGVVVPYQHRAIAEYFPGGDGVKSFFWRTEIVPHLQRLLAGGPEFWWLRGPVAGGLAALLLVILVASSWALVIEVQNASRLAPTSEETPG